MLPTPPTVHSLKPCTTLVRVAQLAGSTPPKLLPWPTDSPAIQRNECGFLFNDLEACFSATKLPIEWGLSLDLLCFPSQSYPCGLTLPFFSAVQTVTIPIGGSGSRVRKAQDP